MTDPLNIILAAVVIGASFFSGMQFKEYQARSQVCAALQKTAESFGGSMAPNNPCTPYL